MGKPSLVVLRHNHSFINKIILNVRVKSSYQYSDIQLSSVIFTVQIDMVLIA